MRARWSAERRVDTDPRGAPDALTPRRQAWQVAPPGTASDKRSGPGQPRELLASRHHCLQTSGPQSSCFFLGNLPDKVRGL